MISGLVDRLHRRSISPRRARKLSAYLSNLIPWGASVLDFGCGEGLVARRLLDRRPDTSICGFDVAAPDRCYIPVTISRSPVLPYDEASFDVVMLVDVLHHTTDPLAVLREAIRIARHRVLIKDHLAQGRFAEMTLRFLDYFGNDCQKAALRCKYWSKEKWNEAYETLGVKIALWDSNLRLYPWPTNYLFDRSLHFIARLDFEQASTSPGRPIEGHISLRWN